MENRTEHDAGSGTETGLVLDGRTFTCEELNALLPEGYRLVETAAWVPREELEKAHGDREIDLALTRSGARNLTAARALLPEDLISASPEAIIAAVEKVKKENQWMFREEPLRASGYPFSPKPAVDPASMTDAEYYEYRRQQKKAR